VGVVLAAALALFLFVGLGTTSSKGSGGGAVVPVGSPAPNFALPSVLGGPPVVLDALGPRRHRPVVLNFFASWCIPCQKETPLLAATATAQQAKGSVVQFVGVDAADKPADAVPFIRTSGITYPVGQDADLRVTAAVYGLNGEPQTFFLDESGTVVGHVIGPVSQTQLDGWIHRLTGGG
jgi:cytochrome c biogenesis protein CcmG/thiol:disulfide interchange protein DsbE